MLQGSLENFDLSDVLGLLSNTSKSGRLRLTGDRGTGSLWLEDGALVSGIIGVRTDAPLEETVFELMRFTAGDFSFSADERPVQAGDPQEVVAVVKGATARLDEWRSIEAVVPSLAHIVRPVGELPSEELTITRRDWQVLLAAGPGASVGSVCAALELGEIDGSREVKHLVDRRLLVMSAPIDAQVIERSFATAEDVGLITDGPEEADTQEYDSQALAPVSFEPASFEPASFEPASLDVAVDEVAPFNQSADGSTFEDLELERVEERVQESFLTRNDSPSFADARHEQLADSEPEFFGSDRVPATSFEAAPFEAAPFEAAPFEPAPFEAAPFEPGQRETAPFPPAQFQAVPEAPIDFGPKDRPTNTSRAIDFGVPTPPAPVTSEDRGFFGTAANDEGFVFDQMPEDAGFAGESPADFPRPASGFAHAGLGVPGAGWAEERRATPVESNWSAPAEASAAAPGWAQGWSSETDWQTTGNGPIGAPPVPQPPAGFAQPVAGATMPAPPPPGFATGGGSPPPPPPAPPIDFGQPFDPVLAADRTRTAISNPDLAKQEMTELLAEDAKTDEGGGSLLMRYLKSER